MSAFKPGCGRDPGTQGEERKQQIIDIAKYWVSIDPFEETRNLIQKLIDENNVTELEKRLIPRIQFGTAGLRGEMTAGYKNMNYVTVQQAAQGVVKYIKSQFPPEQYSRGIVIGYDGRHNSKGYAQVSAAVFTKEGVPAFLFPHFVCTPMVPFTTVNMKTLCGVMVTASHNPKKDNGYKLYWENGAQIIEPHDVGITNNIIANLDLWDVSEYFDSNKQLIFSKVAQWDYTFQIQSYIKKAGELFCFRREQNSSATPLVYTAMHGVGAPFVKQIFEQFNFPPYIPVTEQIEPDPEFSTVYYPNPEEGKGALELAIQTATKLGNNLILANDPDADRLAVSEKLADGTWKIYSGDEIGMCLAYWMFKNYKGTAQAAMLNSTVSSKFIKQICEKHNMIYEETLTGFKWISNKALQLQSQGKQVLFSFEEAIGFQVGMLVNDKDGVCASVVFYEMYEELCRKESRTLLDLISFLRKEYGYWLNYVRYFLCYEPVTIKALFDGIRSRNYGQTIGRFKISGVRDLTVGYDSTTPDKKPVLPVSAAAQMITFWTSEPAESVTTLRTSGTEPKIKYYIDVKHTDEGIAKELLQELKQSVINELLEPQRWGLQNPPSD